MDEVLAGRAGRLAKENADIWETYQKLGKTCYEAGPLEGRTLRLVKPTRHRTGNVDNSLPRVLPHTHCATTALSLQNPMVDPKRTFAPVATMTE